MMNADRRYLLRMLVAGPSATSDLTFVPRSYPGDRVARVAELQAVADSLVADGLAAFDGTETYSVTDAGRAAIADFNAANGIGPP